MADFELETQLIKSKGLKYICGIDEAGRGPWAGPVVAAAVILNPDKIPNGLNDSKKLSEAKRNQLFEEIKQDAIDYNIAFIDSKIIDNINILQATFKAMLQAALSLKTKPQFLLIDGNRDPKIGIETQTIIKGDSKSFSIAAASILAKVARDKYMEEMDKEFPQYGFAKHKGYGVAAHHQAIIKHGPCPIHRMSFKPLKELTTNNF